MGTTDSIPIVSQAKSLVQSACGDNPGAERTQDNFLHECPVVSQLTSTVELISGDKDGAIETQRRCGRNLLRAADGIPLIGHAKGVYHYTSGDKQDGHQSMRAATRTTGVMAAGAGGFVIAGPVGAVTGGVLAGAEMDMVTSGITGEDSGYVAAIDNAIKNPNPGDLFDLAIMPIGDGLAGYGAGELVKGAQPSAAHPDSASNVLGNTQMASRLEVESYLVLERAQAGTNKSSLSPGYYRLIPFIDLQDAFEGRNVQEITESGPEDNLSLTEGAVGVEQLSVAVEDSANDKIIMEEVLNEMLNAESIRQRTGQTEELGEIKMESIATNVDSNEPKINNP